MIKDSSLMYLFQCVVVGYEGLWQDLCETLASLNEDFDSLEYKDPVLASKS